MKRRKIILGVAFIGMLFFTACDHHQGETVVIPKEEVSEQPELSDARKELEMLYEERGHESHLTDSQIFWLGSNRLLPLFEDEPKEYSFDDRMELYLNKLSKIVEKEGEYDFLYNFISDGLIWKYDMYKGELSEEDCKHFLTIINLCKKRLETATVWEEPEDPQEEQWEESEKLEVTIKLTDTRKELELRYEERGDYNLRSHEESEFLRNNYDIPFLEKESSKISFEERYDSYLDEMEELLNHEENVLFEYVSDLLIWDYDRYRGILTEGQCERILKMIKLCEKVK